MTIEGEKPVLWTHRTMPEMDIYSLTNQGDEEVNFKPLFRVANNVKPQRWIALTGEVRQLNDLEVKDG